MFAVLVRVGDIETVTARNEIVTGGDTVGGILSSMVRSVGSLADKAAKHFSMCIISPFILRSIRSSTEFIRFPISFTVMTSLMRCERVTIARGCLWRASVLAKCVEKSPVGCWFSRDSSRYSSREFPAASYDWWAPKLSGIYPDAASVRLSRPEVPVEVVFGGVSELCLFESVFTWCGDETALILIARIGFIDRRVLQPYLQLKELLLNYGW